MESLESLYYCYSEELELKGEMLYEMGLLDDCDEC